ncbi:MAG: hypothetical protein JRN26_02155 [Nitrososphaerota archaeon]|nr:hypothetical protein [Nitrososphaerota archaeon]MDG6932582.1 hypothetical protein [Nitrososphaerota archaeon]MDG6935680.1 hypothetical protein [Nitrososphaerota archaeon]MDG6943455.1 hypothetical protein [Nitrososphaerota archaeon]
MTQINTIYFLTPAIVMAFSVGAVIYWHFKRSFTLNVLLYTFIAYFGAITIKYIFQYLTLVPYSSMIHGNQPLLGVYYGLQTMLLEVGLAYIIARFATSKDKISRKDATGYGLGLAMWENGVLIAIPLMIDYLLYYTLLASPSSSSFYIKLFAAAPALFLPTNQALPLIGFVVLERISSLLSHVAWGYLAVIAAVTGKKRYFYIALPMGLIDFFVPYASSMGITAFELLIFILSFTSLAVALVAGSRSKAGYAVQENVNDSISLFKLNFRRTVSVSKVYILIGIILPILFAGEFSFISSTSATARITISSMYPLIMPLFIIIGSMGALWIFTSDKRKGVYEYLIASGVEVSSVFWSILMITAGLATIILVSVMIITIPIFALAHVQITPIMVETIIFYSIPMCYSSSIFMSMAGMIWASLSKRITGVNSPVGLAPLLGIIPIMVTFLISALVGPYMSLYVAGAVSLGVFALAVVILIIANIKMDRERFLSNE